MIVMTNGLNEELGFISQFEQYLISKVPGIAGFGIRLLVSLVIFWIGTRIIRFGCAGLKRFFTKNKVDDSVSRFLCSFAKAVLYFLLVVMIAMQLGLKEASVVAVIGSMGVGLGLALQGGMANLAGGVLILTLKPFVPGDYIIENNHSQEGTVKKIDMFYTTLSTVDNRLVVIPNAQLTNNSMINVTAQDKRQLEIKVGISYGDDIRQAKDIIERLLREQPDILDGQNVNVFVDELGKSSVVIGCRAWVATEKYWKNKWEMNEKIKLAFDGAGITIPYDQLEIHGKVTLDNQ